MAKIINSIRKYFGQHPNAIIVDTSLSDGAVRVFLYICGKPDDWQFNNRDIQLRLSIKRAETIAKYWKELIESGWISREPKLNNNGKPSGYFDYILNFSPVNPTPKKPEADTTYKPDMQNQQLRKNSSYTNTDIVINKERNTPIPISQSERVIEVWLEFLKTTQYGFDTKEIEAIKEWAIYFTNRNKSVEQTQIKFTFKTLFTHKLANYDVVTIIEQSIAGNMGKIMNPDSSCLIKSTKLVQTKPQRPYKYNNPKYFIPESPSEKRELADYLVNCYRININPKTTKQMSSDEKLLLEAHRKQFSSQTKNEFGAFINYVSWLDYILQNEVYSNTSLLDQPINKRACTQIDQRSLYNRNVL